MGTRIVTGMDTKRDTSLHIILITIIIIKNMHMGTVTAMVARRLLLRRSHIIIRILLPCLLSSNRYWMRKSCFILHPMRNMRRLSLSGHDRAHSSDLIAACINSSFIRWWLPHRLLLRHLLNTGTQLPCRQCMRRTRIHPTQQLMHTHTHIHRLEVI